jgi:imidazolonepropionase-like amidohydrolase
VGGRADLVIWEAERAEDVVAALAPCRLVVKAGRVSVEHARAVAEPWREP